MPDVTIRPLSGPDDLSTFNQLHYVLDGEYADDLDHQRRRPEWMWLALLDDRLVARAAWWGPAGAAKPRLLDVLDVDPVAPDRHQVAVDLVHTALAAMGLTGSLPEYGRYLPAGWHDDPEQTRAVTDRTTVIERLGGQPLVERLRLQWGPDANPPPDRRRLTFRPPTDRGELLDLLTQVLEGTLEAPATGGRLAACPTARRSGLSSRLATTTAGSSPTSVCSPITAATDTSMTYSTTAPGS